MLNRYLSLFLIFFSPAAPDVFSDFTPAKSWSQAKNLLDDKVYFDHRRTIYCGCKYTSDNDSDGSGDINADQCGLQNVQQMRHVRNSIQWEHIVPASRMPIEQWSCWQKEKEIQACKGSDGAVKHKNRNCCERVSPTAKVMILDLFNVAPSAAQLNQYRVNDLYGEIPDDSDYEGFGAQCEARDLNGTTPGPEGLFEPPDCKKGDVARTWFYMRLVHGVIIEPATEALFFNGQQMTLSVSGSANAMIVSQGYRKT